LVAGRQFTESVGEEAGNPTADSVDGMAQIAAGGVPVAVVILGYSKVYLAVSLCGLGG